MGEIPGKFPPRPTSSLQPSTTPPAKATRGLNGNKRWKCLATGGRIPMHLECAEALACFCLTTGLSAATPTPHWFSNGWDLPIMSDHQYGRRSPVELH
ncbi:hypothetical protein CDAR_104011 [Caerostris darwini]|uniref:Uncharacterized protein n=1 Tax=Caerostris darwini TaxID=1538125 RepID=A0AAV4T0D9_9ARAC|nr:hypothetical protein CDAR_104011 [Caerostris darwini]